MIINLLMKNLDIIITSIITAIIILIPIRNRYNIAVARIETSFKNALDSIKANVELIYSECNNIYSIPRVKGRNDSQRSAIRRIKLYLDMIKIDIKIARSIT